MCHECARPRGPPASYAKLRAFIDERPRRGGIPLIDCVVDNRTFLLCLDEWSRGARAVHERGELLDCARTVARALGVSVGDAPVESHYSGDAGLAEYHALMSRLRQVDGARRPLVDAMPEFRRLVAVTSSPLHGSPDPGDRLLPSRCDSLDRAVAQLSPDWSVPRLVDRAHDIAAADDDISLVGMASLIRDPIVLTTLREPVRHIDFSRERGCPVCGPVRRLVWGVDDAIVQRATRFVEEFNTLFGDELPPPNAEHVAWFYSEELGREAVGRCAALGSTTKPPARYYHWRVVEQPGGVLAIDDFWHEELRTTERYRRESTDGYRRPVYRPPRPLQRDPRMHS